MLDPHAINELRYAIIRQACQDYVRALNRLKKQPHSESALRMVEECERFFRGAWYSYLCDIDGEYMIRVLKERTLAGNRRIKFKEKYQEGRRDI